MHRDYPHDPIYNYDVGVSCPRDFQIEFAISLDHQSQFVANKIIAELTDSFTSTRLMPYLDYDDNVPSAIPQGFN